MSGKQQFYSIQPTLEQLNNIKQFEMLYDSNNIKQCGYLTGVEVYKIEENGETRYELKIDEDSRLIIKNEVSMFQEKQSNKAYVYDQIEFNGDEQKPKGYIIDKDECKNFKMKHLE